MDSKQFIAVFDSGIGGMTVLHDLVKLLPHEHYLYYADTDHLPYGTKSTEEIKSCVYRSVKFLANYDLKALVLACNTATSVAVNSLRSEYNFPIIGMEPAVKPAITHSDRRVMVCATDRTIQEQKLHDLIANLDGDDKVDLRSLQPLVLLAEDCAFHYDQVYPILDSTLHDVDWEQYDYLVLGCTHFIYFKQILSYYLPPWITIIDGNHGTARRVKSLITANTTDIELKVEYFKSGRKAKESLFIKYLDRLTDYQT